jgi:hypothetical protein
MHVARESLEASELIMIQLVKPTSHVPTENIKSTAVLTANISEQTAAQLSNLQDARVSLLLLPVLKFSAHKEPCATTMGLPDKESVIAQLDRMLKSLTTESQLAFPMFNRCPCPCLLVMPGIRNLVSRVVPNMKPLPNS